MKLPVGRGEVMAEIDDGFVMMVHVHVHVHANDDHNSDLSRHDVEPGAARHAWLETVERVL
jgi:fumarate hydratase class II